MIVGVGIDIVDVSRIERLLKQYGDQFAARLGFDVRRCMEFVEDSEMMGVFRKMLFSRIVPTVKDIGLWGAKVQKAYEEMGVISFSDMNPEELIAQDEDHARKLDETRGLPEEAEAAASLAGVDRERAMEVEQTIRAGTDGPGQA